MSTNNAAERLCEYPDCKGAWGHPSPHLIEATAIERRLAAAKQAGYNEAQGFAEVRIEEMRRATVERIRAGAQDDLLEAATLSGDFLDSVITWRDLERRLDAEAER